MMEMETYLKFTWYSQETFTTVTFAFFASSDQTKDNPIKDSVRFVDAVLGSG
jgi:hypothetical protein